MKSPIAPVRVHARKTLVLRDAFVVQLVLVGKRAAIAPGLSLALDAYLAWIPPGALRWALMGSNSTTVRAYKGAADATRAKTMLRDNKGAYFWFGSDDDPAKPAKAEPDDPAYLVMASVDDESPNKVVEFRVPTAYVWERGIEDTYAFVCRLVKLSPTVQSGYAGLELVQHPMLTDTSHHGRAAIAPIAATRPGYTFGDPTTVTLADAPSTRLRAINWLTILGKGQIVRTGAAPSDKPDAAAFGKLFAKLLPKLELGDTFQSQLFEDADGERDPLAFAAWEFRFGGGLAGAKQYLDRQRGAAARIRRAHIAIAEGDEATATKLVDALAAAKVDREEVNQLRYQLATRAERRGKIADALRWYDAMLAAAPDTDWIAQTRDALAARLPAKVKRRR